MLDRKKIIIAFSLVAVFITVMALAMMALQKEPSEELVAEQIKQEALKEAESTTHEDNGEINYTIEFNPEDGFQVVYEEDEDKFTIFIMKSASQGLSNKEFNALRTEIENHFIKNILKTEDKGVVCSLDVVITTLGAGDHYLAPSPLNYCD